MTELERLEARIWAYIKKKGLSKKAFYPIYSTYMTANFGWQQYE
jgi:hypothetical protein